MELEEFKRWCSKKYCLEQMKQNGNNLQFVKKQNDEICMEAVKENGDALRYVEDEKLFVKLKMMEKINGSN